MKKEALKICAGLMLKTAKRAGNAASVYGMYQPKEPEVLRKAKEKNAEPEE